MTRPLLAMSNRVLLEKSKGPGGKWYLIELNKRFAYPAACLVLMLIGVPLGVSSKRGGKSAGFVLTIALVFILLLSLVNGCRAWPPEKLPVFVGVWMANIVFAVCGLLLLRQMATGGRLMHAVLFRFLPGEKTIQRKKVLLHPLPVPFPGATAQRRAGFPLILDDYVLARIPHDLCPWCWSVSFC